MTGLLVAAVLIGLAVHRLWRITARDTILEQPRSWLLARTDVPAVRWLMELVLCPWCLGFHLNAVASGVAAYAYDWHPVEWLLVWFAASTVTGTVDALGRD